ncbi:hypothetical protein KFE25_012146 [Diacronema lutheri]|uniref:Uncharacterized protein n=1 Tax=Diacronema lutheri TaxID=2081491 RepID=A0A8J5X6R5_DIALT|nr:hypothetical protein KFE25_012146 [Diacronema lutheri]
MAELPAAWPSPAGPPRLSILGEVAFGVVDAVASHFTIGTGSVGRLLAGAAAHDQRRLEREARIGALAAERTAATSARGAHVIAHADRALVEKVARVRSAEVALTAAGVELARERGLHARLLCELELLKGEAGMCLPPVRGSMQSGRAYLEQLEASKVELDRSTEHARAALREAQARGAQVARATAAGGAGGGDGGGECGARGSGGAGSGSASAPAREATRPLVRPTPPPSAKRARMQPRTAAAAMHIPEPSTSRTTCMPAGLHGGTSAAAPVPLGACGPAVGAGALWPDEMLRASGPHTHGSATGTGARPARRNDAIVPLTANASIGASTHWQVTHVHPPRDKSGGFKPPLMRKD